MSLVFEDVRKLVEGYRLDTLAQSIITKPEIDFKTEDEEITCILRDFLQLANEFLKEKNEIASSNGALVWLEWIYRALELESRLIQTVGEKSYNNYDDSTRWYIEFATDSMVEIIQRVQRWIKQKAKFFKNSRQDYYSLRQSVICVLGNLTYSLTTIVFAVIKVNKKEMKPQGLYEVVAEALIPVDRII